MLNAVIDCEVYSPDQLRGKSLFPGGSDLARIAERRGYEVPKSAPPGDLEEKANYAARMHVLGKQVYPPALLVTMDEADRKELSEAEPPTEPYRQHLDPMWQMRECFKILTESHGKKAVGTGKLELDVQVLRNALASCGDELDVGLFDEFLSLTGHAYRGAVDEERFMDSLVNMARLDKVHFHEKPPEPKEPRAPELAVYDETQLRAMPPLSSRPPQPRGASRRKARPRRSS